MKKKNKKAYVTESKIIWTHWKTDVKQQLVQFSFQERYIISTNNFCKVRPLKKRDTVQIATVIDNIWVFKYYSGQSLSNYTKNKLV